MDDDGYTFIGGHVAFGEITAEKIYPIFCIPTQINST
jgi:hypothetical protein